MHLLCHFLPQDWNHHRRAVLIIVSNKCLFGVDTPLLFLKSLSNAFAVIPLIKSIIMYYYNLRLYCVQIDHYYYRQIDNFMPWYFLFMTILMYRLCMDVLQCHYNELGCVTNVITETKKSTMWRKQRRVVDSDNLKSTLTHLVHVVTITCRWLWSKWRTKTAQAWSILLVNVCRCNLNSQQTLTFKLVRM